MNEGRTLGISLGHDSGVAILQDEEIVFAANEERFSRIKGHSGVPREALFYLLKNGDLENIDRIAVDGKIVAPHGIDKKYRFEQSSGGLQGFAEFIKIESIFLKGHLGISLLKAIFFLLHYEKRQNQNSYVKKLVGNLSLPVTRVDHHMAHAASIAFPGDSSTTGLVVTLDGIGEGICSRVLRFDSGELRPLQSTPALGSPALMYGYATKILGYRINRHEGKLTGLAAYGIPDRTAPIFLKHFSYKNFKLASKNIGYGRSAIKQLSRELSGYSHEDIAAGVQYALEINVTSWIRDLIQKYGESRIYLSGGAFANVKLNQRIAQISEIKDVIVSPNMGDGGLALGTAVLAHPTKVSLSTLYLGTNIESKVDASAEAKLIYAGEEFHEFIARLLSEEKIVAIARGRMEFGPRALGNRSILYSAMKREVNQWLNTKLNRTEFMPFAPICRDIDAHKNFKLDLSIERYKHMTMTCDVTDYCKETAPAVVHVDGTARPQIVFEEENPDLYQILSAYSRFVENAVLVNTSFNMHEEPIVRTSEEALRAFKRSGIDYLLLGNQVFVKS